MATFGMPEEEQKRPRKEWKTLQEARQERPLTGHSNVSIKAPLPPRKD